MILHQLKYNPIVECHPHILVFMSLHHYFLPGYLFQLFLLFFNSFFLLLFFFFCFNSYSVLLQLKVTNSFSKYYHNHFVLHIIFLICLNFYKFLASGLKFTYPVSYRIHHIFLLRSYVRILKLILIVFITLNQYFLFICYILYFSSYNMHFPTKKFCSKTNL